VKQIRNNFLRKNSVLNTAGKLVLLTLIYCVVISKSVIKTIQGDTETTAEYVIHRNLRKSQKKKILLRLFFK
jgi:hypothetical protein